MADLMCESPPRPFEILLVEDNQRDAAQTREAFKSARTPTSVSIAGDGEEALRMLRREAPHADQIVPDVILLDFDLRRKHGHQIIDEISRDSLMRKIPIVVMTNSEADIDLVRRERLPAKSYIMKPVDVESVQRVIALIAADNGSSGQHADLPPQTPTEKELSEFSYAVSHDLAAPLRHIAAFSTLLIRSIGPDPTVEQSEYCDHILGATRKCQAMLDELLAFSRAQQAQMVLETCDATLLMEVAMLQLSAQVQSAGAEITIEPLGKAVMDSALMTLVFKQALSNAIKFRTADTAVKINVAAAPDADAWTVRVSDNGPGVALDRQDKLFRLFYQDVPEGTFEGVGAGLAIMRRVLRRHGGDARFVEAEQGACLELSLPVNAAAPLTPSAP
jgi:signal transduction histidine kinase